MKYAFLLFFVILSSFCNAADRIWDGGGDGVSWDDAANWDAGGLPTINDRAIIDDDSVAVSTSVSVYSIVLYSDLTISSSGSLLVKDGSLTLTQGKANTINNYGSLTIINGLLSIPVDGRFMNRFNSTFSTSGGGNGIINYGRILNRLNADIFISFSTSEGLINYGEFENRGYIEVFECDLGILNESPNIASDKAQILNTGTLKIFNTALEGIENKGGIIDNEGELEVYNNGTFSIESSFGNGLSSEMYNRTGASMIIRDGLVAGSQFENDGMLRVENIGDLALASGGKFINNDTLYISAIEATGLSVGDSLINSSTGVILSDSVKSKIGFTTYFITSQRYIKNEGQIYLLLQNQVSGISQPAGTSDKMFDNYGDIEVIQSAGYAINNHQYFLNRTGGIISIDGANGSLPTISNSDSLVNDGEVFLLNGTNTGGYLQPNGDSFFENNGLFKVDNTSGAYALKIQNGKFVNNLGSIELSNNNVDVLVDNQATFFNESSIYGYFNTCNTNFENTGSLDFQAKFENRGNFDLLSNLDAELINEGDFINGYCGIFQNYCKIVNRENALIINYGRFNNLSKEAIDNDWFIVNYGVFNSTFRFMEEEFQAQDGIYWSSIPITPKENWTIPIVLTDNLPTAMIDSKWYSDESLTMQVADYDSSNSTLTFIDNVDGLNSLYFEINGFTNSCLDGVYNIKIIDINDFSCQNIISNAFNQTVDNDWFKKENWSLAKLPNYCTDVNLSPNKELLLFLEHYGVANKIEIQTGSLLDAQSGSVLDAWNGL